MKYGCTPGDEEKEYFNTDCGLSFLSVGAVGRLIMAKIQLKQAFGLQRSTRKRHNNKKSLWRCGVCVDKPNLENLHRLRADQCVGN